MIVAKKEAGDKAVRSRQGTKSHPKVEKHILAKKRVKGNEAKGRSLASRPASLSALTLAAPMRKIIAWE